MKERLDIILLNKGLFQTREKARSAIMAGLVLVNGLVSDKPGTLLDSEKNNIEVKGQLCPYVSRGGLKLEKALDFFNIDLSGLKAIDVGASTGGFTDCMLKKGASSVLAIDVGYGQLAWKLRIDPRVVVMERTNIKYVTSEKIPFIGNFATIDVSFISACKVLPAVTKLLLPGSGIVCLIKPQFEAGREKVGKKGVVRDAGVHREVLNEVLHNSVSMNLSLYGITWSPIKGPEGNIEFLMYLGLSDGTNQPCSDIKEAEEAIYEIVKEAHFSLNRLV